MEPFKADRFALDTRVVPCTDIEPKPARRGVADSLIRMLQPSELAQVARRNFIANESLDSASF